MLPNLQSALGILAFVGLAWVLSESRARFPTRIVLAGLALQFALAVALLKLPLFQGRSTSSKSPPAQGSGW